MLELVLRTTENKYMYTYSIEKSFFKHTVNAVNGGNSVRSVNSYLPAVAQPNPVNFPLLYIRNDGKNRLQSVSSRLSYQ